MDSKTLYIHTDGACSGNGSSDNVGGWGAVLEYGKHRKELSGGEVNTTNNRMEMTALAKAFEALNKTGQNICVFSDSSYLMECFRKKWYVNWQKNGWKTSKKEPVENRDLWEILLRHMSSHHISFYRVKGHVNTASDSVSLAPVFLKFKEWNGEAFDYNDFLHISEMNGLADSLATGAIEEIRFRL